MSDSILTAEQVQEWVTFACGIPSEMRMVRNGDLMELARSHERLREQRDEAEDKVARLTAALERSARYPCRIWAEDGCFDYGRTLSGDRPCGPCAARAALTAEETK